MLYKQWQKYDALPFHVISVPILKLWKKRVSAWKIHVLPFFFFFSTLCSILAGVLLVYIFFSLHHQLVLGWSRCPPPPYPPPLFRHFGRIWATDMETKAKDFRITHFCIFIIFQIKFCNRFPTSWVLPVDWKRFPAFVWMGAKHNVPDHTVGRNLCHPINKHHWACSMMWYTLDHKLASPAPSLFPGLFFSSRATLCSTLLWIDLPWWIQPTSDPPPSVCGVSFLVVLAMDCKH